MKSYGFRNHPVPSINCNSDFPYLLHGITVGNKGVTGRKQRKFREPDMAILGSLPRPNSTLVLPSPALFLKLTNGIEVWEV